MCKDDIVVTITDLLAERGLELAPLLLPRPGTEVRWVAVSELSDPSPFLEGGEVLLTTGLDMGAWDEPEWDGYVGRLADVGVAAIGLAVGLTHQQVPDGLRTSCAAHEVNLFEVPRQTTFVAVSRTVAHLQAEREQAAAREALDVLRRLTQAALRDHESAALLSTLATAVGGAAAVVDSDGTGTERAVGPRADLVDEHGVVPEVARMRRHGLRAAAQVSMSGGSLLVHPIGVRGRPESYLAVAIPGRVSDAQRSFVMTTVALLSLAAERNRGRRQTERRLRARALEVLIAGDLRTAAVLLEAGSEGESPRLPSRVSVLRATGPRDLREDLLRALEVQFQMSGLLGDELVVAVPPRQLPSALHALEHQTGLRAGVGEVRPLAQLRRSHQTAGHALATASDAVPVVHWEANVRHGALSLIDADRAEAFAETLLSPLTGELEREHLETLQSFLRHHGSLVKVADELGVHRNTVRNRVAAIEGALRRSLDDPQTRVDVWLALQARHR